MSAELFENNLRNDSKFKDLVTKYGRFSIYEYVTSDLAPDFNRFTREEELLYEDYFSNSTYFHKSLLEEILDDINFTTRKMNKGIWSRGPLLINGDECGFKTIRGGVSNLPEAIYWLLGYDKVLLNKQVTTIEALSAEENRAVDVYYTDVLNDRKDKKRFDRFICTIPSTTCANIDWIELDKNGDEVIGKSETDLFMNALKTFRVLT
jgi:hypothetical protein